VVNRLCDEEGFDFYVSSGNPKQKKILNWNFVLHRRIYQLLAWRIVRSDCVESALNSHQFKWQCGLPPVFCLWEPESCKLYLFICTPITSKFRA
jgi:hypothetical protein